VSCVDPWILGHNLAGIPACLGSRDSKHGPGGGRAPVQQQQQQQISLTTTKGTP
jgi:hypothetical protein